MTHAIPKKRVPTAYALAKKAEEKAKKAADKEFEKCPNRVAKRHWGELMSEKFSELETARYNGPDDWRNLESLVDQFGGYEFKLIERSAVITKNFAIIARLAKQAPPPVDLPDKRKAVYKQHSNFEHTLRCVARRTADLQAEIQHCRDELVLANAEHFAWLLDGTACAETPFFQQLQAAGTGAGPAGHAPRKAKPLRSPRAGASAPAKTAKP